MQFRGLNPKNVCNFQIQMKLNPKNVCNFSIQMKLNAKNVCNFLELKFVVCDVFLDKKLPCFFLNF